MTARAAITKTELKRRLEAVQAAGLSAAEIRPDGTIVLGTAAQPSASDKQEAEDALEKWLAQKN